MNIYIFEQKILRKLQIMLRAPLRPIVRFLLYFFYETHFVIGDQGTLKIGERVVLANTLFNLSSGSIFIGDYTIFSHNVMVITGRHLFKDGKRASLAEGTPMESWGGGEEEVPSSGFDIHIGNGTWIASGAIISGKVHIGDNVIIAANSVVTRNIPDYAIVAGAPARIIGDTRNM